MGAMSLRSWLLAILALIAFASAPVAAQDSESLAWARATSCALIRDYLARYPNGRYAANAREQLTVRACPEPSRPAANPCASVEQVWSNTLRTSTDRDALERFILETPRQCSVVRDAAAARLASLPQPSRPQQPAPVPELAPLMPASMPNDTADSLEALTREGLRPSAAAWLARESERAAGYFRPHTERTSRRGENSSSHFTERNAHCPTVRLLARDLPIFSVIEGNSAAIFQAPFLWSAATRDRTTGCMGEARAPSESEWTAAHVQLFAGTATLRRGATPLASGGGREDPHELSGSIDLDPAESSPRRIRVEHRYRINYPSLPPTYPNGYSTTVSDIGSCVETRRWAAGAWNSAFPFAIVAMDCETSSEADAVGEDNDHRSRNRFSQFIVPELATTVTFVGPTQSSSLTSFSSGSVLTSTSTSTPTDVQVTSNGDEIRVRYTQRSSSDSASGRSTSATEVEIVYALR